MNEKIVKLMEKLSADEQYAENLFSKETAEEAQAVLKEAGEDFTIEEVMELRDIMIQIAEATNDGELSEEDLEKIAGGNFWKDTVAYPFVATGKIYGGMFTHVGRSIGSGVRRIFRRW